MFGAKYSRQKFWIWSVVLIIPFVIVSSLIQIMEYQQKNNSSDSISGALVLYGIAMLINATWMNALANRIRDYGSNPWYALFALLPLVNIGLALYYGISKSAIKEESVNNSNDTNSSLAKAVYNHSKDIASEIKPAVEEYKESHKTSKSDFNITEDELCFLNQYSLNPNSPNVTINDEIISIRMHNSSPKVYFRKNNTVSNTRDKSKNDAGVKDFDDSYFSKLKEEKFNYLNEDEIYEQALTEIEEDKKVKSTWAKALAQSEGNKDKAESLYINMRVHDIKIEKSNKKKLDFQKVTTLTEAEKNFLEQFGVNTSSPNLNINKNEITIDLADGNIKRFKRKNQVVLHEKSNSLSSKDNILLNRYKDSMLYKKYQKLGYSDELFIDELKKSGYR